MTDLHVAPGSTRQISLRRELTSLPTAPGEPPTRRRRDDGWLDRWLDTCSDLARLQATLDDLIVRGLRAAGPCEMARLIALGDEFRRAGAGHIAGRLVDLVDGLRADDRASA